MPFASIDKYVNNYETSPFFLVAGDSNYTSIKDGLSNRGFKMLATSEFCSTPDILPNFDALISKIRGLEIGDKRFVVGVGEYLSLRDVSWVERYLARLKETHTNGKVVLLLRGVANDVVQLQKNDPRFDRRRVFIAPEEKSSIEIKAYSPNVEISGTTNDIFDGFQALLRELENGRQGEVCVKTCITFDRTLYKICRIDTPYELVREFLPDFQVPQECGNDKNWNRLASELAKKCSDFNSFLASHGLNDSLDDMILKVNKTLFKENYKNWLIFIALKYRQDSFKNPYFTYALDKATTPGKLKNAIISSLGDFSHNHKLYASYYEARKTLLRMISVDDRDMFNFIAENRVDPNESIYRLTDLTKIERDEIISWISEHGIVPELEKIYPALASYLTPYSFRVGDNSQKLTEYFEAYKDQKVRNKLDPKFLKQVESYATDRIFYELQTREEVIEKLKQEYIDSIDKTRLYWLDAFGVEYLGLVTKICNEHGLDASIEITRASLPTITKENRKFFDDWKGPSQPNPDLDVVKHKLQGGFDFTTDTKPKYIVKELQIVTDVIEGIAKDLKERDFSRVILTSDHGASRLAVLAEQEEKYDAGTKGEHSGRCCKKIEENQKYELPFATESNDWIVLANYGRFKGSRKANVEVHGGASLEEVVVPVITLTLRDNSVEIILPEPIVKIAHKESATVCLFSKNVLNESLSLDVYDHKDKLLGNYPMTTKDRQHFYVTLDAVRHSGKYKLKVYRNNVLYNKEFDLTVKSSIINEVDDGFDDF